MRMAHAAPVLVDTTEDDSVLGFPDSRKLAVDAQGNLYVAYRKRFKLLKTTRFHIFVSKSSDGGATWQVTNGGRPVEEVGDFVQRVPSIAVDADDVIHVIWYGTDAQFSGTNERQIKYVQSADGGASWSMWRNIGPVMGYADDALWQEHPVIHIDAQNNLFVAWQGRDADYEEKSQIKWSRSTDGGVTWSAWRNISADPARSFSRPALLSTPDGQLYALAYADGQRGMRILWTRSDDDGATWQEWAMVAPGQRDQRHFSAAVDQQGQIHLAWRQMAEADAAPGATLIHYARYDGRAWGKAAPVAPLSSPDTPRYQFFPTLTLDAQDSPWLAWLETVDPSGYPQEKPITGAIRYATSVQAGWRTPQILAQGAALYPSFAYPDQHRLASSLPLLVWEERRADAEVQILFADLFLNP
ncbi:MAG: sialidase family protein [Caldilineaceae bacterium]